MAKAAIVVFAETEGHGNLARAVNALTTAKEFKDAGEDSTVVFDGAGTAWIPVLAAPDHPAHRLYESVKDRIGGACSFCARAFGVKDEIEELGVTLLDEYKAHPSLRKLVDGGYEVITF